MASFVEAPGHGADEGYFESLYETYRNDVQRLASYLLKNAADAEDAAQTVFLNVLRALRQGVTPTDPRAWLLAITRNVCFSRRRSAAARPESVELDPDVAAELAPEAGPTAEEIVGALTRLLPNQRTALILRDFRGVSRAEISQLMALSPSGVEALLSRARTAFREELEAGEQPFVCAETRVLVEQQLDGLITVASRHSLRSHLRHCDPCSTLARTIRSSRGKLAGLLFWPADLISRLVSALSQAPTAAHVVGAVASTAAIVSVAVPVAVTTNSRSAHAEPSTPPAAAVAVAPTHAGHDVAPSSAGRATATPAARASRSTVQHKAVRKHATTARPRHKAATGHRRHEAATGHHRVHQDPGARAAGNAVVATGAPVTASASPASDATVASSPTRPTNSVHAIQVSAHDAPATSPNRISGWASPHSISPALRGHGSPASRPHARAKAKPKRRTWPARRVKRRIGGIRAPEPTAQLPAADGVGDTPPADVSPSETTTGGLAIGADVTPAVVPPPTPPASSSSAGGSQSSNSQDGNGNGKTH